MRTIVPRWPSAVGVFAVVSGLLFGFLGLTALTQTRAEPAELIGGSVYTADGVEVGEVSAVTVGQDGQIDEIRVTTALPLGFGQRTVVLKRGSFMALRGAIVLDMSAAEFDMLPTPILLRGAKA